MRCFSERMAHRHMQRSFAHGPCLYRAEADMGRSRRWSGFDSSHRDADRGTAVVEWGYARCYSGLRPVNFTTLPHFSVSSAIS